MSSPTVWVVDDDRSIRWVLEKALQGAGLQHAVFDSAKAARKALEAETPTVVMTDIRMPGEDGLSLLEHFHTVSPKLPVIVMTAHSDLDSAVASYSRGAFEYLPKPFDVDDAILLVQRALERHQQHPITTEAEVDMLNHRFWVKHPQCKMSFEPSAGLPKQKSPCSLTASLEQEKSWSPRLFIPTHPEKTDPLSR